MKEIIIGKNDDSQRADRFFKKYFIKANKSFIYKMLRKKRIKRNGSRLNPEDILYENDTIQLYLSDETIEKFTDSEKDIKEMSKIDIAYEDSNIIIIDKPSGVLTHSANNDYSEKDIVSDMIAYLYKKGDYVPRIEKTFTPSVCNRLDRNTSGLLIGAKNYEALKSINRAIRNRNIIKLYKTIVRGKIDRDLSLRASLKKDDFKNKVFITNRVSDKEKEILTDIKPLRTNGYYTELEINLITGRTHQIRAHLAFEGFPVIGDRKYRDKKINAEFEKKFGLKNQLLHAYKLIFDGFEGDLSYLNGKIFLSSTKGIYNLIEEDIFEGE